MHYSSTAVSLPSALLDHVSQAVIELDHNHHLLFANASAQHLLPRSSGSISSKSIWEQFPLLADSSLHKLVARAHNEKQALSEKCIIPFTGMHALVHAAPTAAGVIVMIDESEENDTHRQLREEHSRFNHVQAIGHVGSFEWEAETGASQWSDEMYRIHGLEPQSIVITLEKALKFVHPEDAGWLAGRIARVKEKAACDDFIHRIIDAKGEVRYLNRRIQSFAGDNGKVTHVRGTVLEITELKNAEQQLIRLQEQLAQQAIEKYVTLFNSVDQGFCIIEMMFNEKDEPIDYRFLEVNPVFEKQTGLSNAAGRTMKELAPAHEDHWFAIYGEIARTGKPKRFEQKAKHLAGGAWYEVYAFPIGKAGNLQVGVLFNNITARKRNEEHQAIISGISGELNRLEHIGRTMEKLGEMIGRYFGVTWCMFIEPGDDLQTSVVNYGWNANEVIPLKGTYRIGDFLSGEELARHNTGEPCIISDTASDPRVNGEKYMSLGIRSFIIVPLTHNGQWDFQLSIIHNEPREWRADEISLLKELNSRIWVRLEKARAEEALREQEKQYSSLVNNLPDVIFKLDKDLRYLFISPNIESITGAAPSQWLGKTAREMGLPADACELLDRRCIEAMETGIETQMELEISYAHFRIRIIPEYNSSGAINSFLGISENITERKISEEALHRAEEKYRNDLEKEVKQRTAELAESKYFIESISKTIPDIVTVIEIRTGIIEYTNKDVMSMLGYNDQDILSMPVEERRKMLHPDDMQKVMEYYKRFAALRIDDENRVEYRVFGKKKNIIWLSLRGKVFRTDDNGVPTHSLNIARDVTAAKQVEEHLAETYEALSKQQTLLNAAEKIGQMGSWEKNLNTRELRWSDELYRIYGLEPQSRTMTSEFYVNNLIHPKDRAKVKAHLKSIYEKHNEKPAEYRIMTPEGEKVVLSQPKITFSENGEAKMFRGIVRDITRQKKAEEELLSLRLKQQKELLNAVMMAQEAERERIGEALHNGVGQLLYGIKIRNEMLELKSSEAIAQLKQINQVLDEAINETRSISFQLVPSVLKDFGLEHALKALLGRIVKPGLHIKADTKELRQRLPENYEISIYRITQELVNNIIKHSKASAAYITIKKDAEKITLLVQDNGVGFDEQQAYGLHKGIGLQSIRNRAQLLNASLCVDSGEGAGTKVCVEIPVGDRD